MAKDVITRFKLETTQYDSKLRDAAKGLAEYSRTATNAGKEFDKFTKSNVDAARALGATATSTQNAKDQVKELVGAFNDAAKAYNNLTREQQQSDFGKALSGSLQQLQQRIRETKQEMQSLGDSTKGTGGLFGGDKLSGMLQVFGGNVMTKLASAGMSLASEIGDSVQEGARLAKEAEGIKLAFDRLDDPTLLDALKEATNGTVSELELMKAAVKFNDFKLPLEELGSMLAFAQKKAKDTGQSVDYMVDSIVTGLGRKSLMILDNLGLSAAEIKEKMKETGDMTKAVGAIIREQMAKAGDYVDTAADKAARANAELENRLRVLGETMRETFGFSGVSDLATAIKTELVGSLQFTIETIGEAKKRFNELMQLMGIQKKPQKNPSSEPPKVFPNGTYWETTDSEGRVTASGRWLNGKRVQTGAGDVVVTGNKPDANVASLKQKIRNLQAERKKAIASGDTDRSKDLLKQINQAKSDLRGLDPNALKTTSAHKETPQEKAQKRMSDAQHKYAVALEKAQAELDAGTITEADFKKVQKRAAESLFEAADDAYQTFADPQYKAVKDDAKQKFVALGGEIKTLTETEKANQKAAREQEQAQKKLTEAQDRRAEALKNGNLKEYLSASATLQKQGGTDALSDMERDEVVLPVNFAFNEDNLKAFIADLQDRLSHSEYGSAIWQALTAQLADANSLQMLTGTATSAGLDPTKFGLGSLWASLLNMTPGDYIGNGTITGTSRQLRKAGAKNTNVDPNTGKPVKDKDNSFVDVAGKLQGGVSSMVNSLEQLGIQIPEGFKGVLSGISGAIGVLQAIMVIVEAIEAMETVGTFLGIFAKGGVVHAARGFVPGNNFSDNVPALLSSGELVLNRAQQGNLASQLEGGAGLGELNLSAVIRGEQIRLVLNNNGRRTGRGEYVQSKSVK